MHAIPVNCNVGWVLFLVFAGWGMFAAPIDWIHQYIARPRAVITKSEYIERARGLAMRARDIKVYGDAREYTHTHTRARVFYRCL